MLVAGRAFGSDLRAAVLLASRRYVVALPGVLIPAVLSALASFAEDRRAGSFVVFIVQIASLATWVMGTNYVYGVYARHRIPRDPAKANVGFWGVAGAMWTVGWPLLVLSVIAVAIMNAVRVPGAAAVALYAYFVVVVGAAVLGGWAFTYVVTDDAVPRTARVRVYRTLSRGAEFCRLVAVTIVLIASALALPFALQAAAGLFSPHPPYAASAALRVAGEIIWWPFALALVLVTRPAVDVLSAAAPAARPRKRRRGEIRVPSWLEWAARLFREPPSRAG